MNYPDKIWCKFWDGATHYVAEYAHKKKEHEEGYYLTCKGFVVCPEESMTMSKEEIQLRLAIYGVDEEWYCTKFSPGYMPMYIDISLFNRGLMKSKKLEI